MPIQKSLLCVLLALCVFPAATFAADAAASEWMTDYKAALEQARKADKPILLHFYASWCGPCQSMEGQVLNTANVKKLIGRDVIAVKIDTDEHHDLVEKFSVRSLPSDVIIDSDGKVLHRVAGFQDKAAYSQMVTKISSTYQPKGKPEETETADQPTKPIIGLDGYSPVVLMDERQWKKGSAQWSHTYQGITYYLRSEDELELFKSEPARFAPQLLGCDPVELWKSDLAVSGDTKYGAYFDGQLFLFATHDNRETFKENPLRYTATKHVLKATEIVLR